MRVESIIVTVPVVHTHTPPSHPQICEYLTTYVTSCEREREIWAWKKAHGGIGIGADLALFSRGCVHKKLKNCFLK